MLVVVDQPATISALPVAAPAAPGHFWADGQVSLRHTPVDVPAAIEALVAGSTYPNVRA